MRHGYGQETKKFGYGMLAVLPMLILYEIGLWQGTLGDHLNGADAILRLGLQFLAAMFGLHWGTWLITGVVGALAIGFLWYLWRQRIRFSFLYVLGMYVEAAIAGIVLAILVYLILSRHLPHFFAFQANTGVVRQLSVQGLITPWSKIVAAVGAGVFEELLFRVLLLGVLYRLWARPGKALGDDQPAALRATLLSSVIFSALHLGSASVGGLLSIFSASILLSGVYLTRGYGIAALTHIAYDLYLMFGIIA